MKTMNPLHRLILLILLAIATTTDVSPRTVQAEEPQPLSITLEEYSYPYPVSYLPLVIEGQNLKMAYMDVNATVMAAFDLGFSCTVAAKKESVEIVQSEACLARLWHCSVPAQSGVIGGADDHT